MKHIASPIRLLTAVPICDGHDSAINTINLELIHHGVEVIYLGYNRPVRDIVRAAIQEDVRAIGISSYNGGHVEFFTQVLRQIRAAGAGDIGVFGGGGGTITQTDAATLRRRGVDEIFFAGTPLDEMVQFVLKKYGKPSLARITGKNTDRRLARQLTLTELGTSNFVGSALRTTRFRNAGLVRGADPTGISHSHLAAGRPRVIGVTGPGGAGKTTLIDELVLRFLTIQPKWRIAILSHDPSIIGKGALLGDRATMIYSQDDRVFMRSLATRGQAGGVSAATENCLRVLRQEPFDVILVETVGIGQEAFPFADGLVDKTVLVMSPEYGSRLQLQKIVMLDAADAVVVNKSDLAGAKTAVSEIEQRLNLSRHDRPVIGAIAKRHRDAGVDALFRFLTMDQSGMKP